MVRRTSRIRVRRTVTVRRTVQIRRQVHVQQRSLGQQQRSLTHRGAPRRSPTVASLVDDGFGPIDDPNREFDLFLCHATENKEFVRPLVGQLEALGVNVWYDETAVSVGDSLRESIDRGLARSRFGAVILSQEFFAKRWTNYELNGLITREMQGRKVVLPVWHPNLTFEALMDFSPSLADKKALVAADSTLAEIAHQLAELICV